MYFARGRFPMVPQLIGVLACSGLIGTAAAVDAAVASSPECHSPHVDERGWYHDPRLEPRPSLLLAQNTATIPTPVPADSPKKTEPPEQVSDAERITRLQRAIEADQKALQQIEANLNDPASEYFQAESEFKQLDTQLEELKKSLSSIPEGQEPDESAATTCQQKIDELTPGWKLAKERFELSIQERKTKQSKAATLKQKVVQETEALDRLTGPPATATVPADAAPIETHTAPPVAASVTNSVEPAVATPAPAAVTTPAPVAADVTPAPPAATSAAVAADQPPPPPSPANATTSSATLDAPRSQALAKATKEAETKEAQAQEAAKDVQSVADRMELLRKDIQLEQELVHTARKKADIALETERQLQEDYQTKLGEDADPAVLTELRRKLLQARQRFSEAREESRERSNRLDDLRTRYTSLQSEQIVVLQEAERTQLEAKNAMKKVAALRNPFTAHNMLQWSLDHGPRILIILATMIAAIWMTRMAELRIIDVMVKRNGLGHETELENRARTLVGVFHNAANVAVISGGLLMILDTIGAPISALMGGAAMVGLAVAFGAQSLIKDYFYGFMILLEQQYTVNDVVKIGEIAGQVERISLRMTVLRDLQGHVHFVPHGNITCTTNMSHGWSRAVFEIGVAYKEDADRVIEVIRQVGTDLRRDPAYAYLILEDLTMLGLDDFGDSAIIFKFFIKTRPLKQWEIKRAFLHRLKRAFDEYGIEIPYPHRTVYHRYESLEAPQALESRRDAA